MLSENAAVKKPRVRKKPALIEDEPVVMQPLSSPLKLPKPLSKYNIADARKQWRILDPLTIKWVERDEFVQRCVGEGAKECPVEQTVLDMTAPGVKILSDAEKELRQHAVTYITLRNKAARLPKFGKWVSSMFKDNKEFAVILSKAAQNQAGTIVISDDIVDMLRAGSSKHYYSCLGPGGGFEEVIKTACEKCPGVFVAYLNHPDQDMKWRSWLHHIVVDGENCVGAMRPYGQGATLQQLASILADKNIKLYQLYSGYGPTAESVKVEGVNLFKESLHWDLHTWKQLYGTLIKPTKD